MSEIELAPQTWQVWTTHTSTEAQSIAKVIRRRHREQYQHQRCPYPECSEHPDPDYQGQTNMPHAERNRRP